MSLLLHLARSAGRGIRAFLVEALGYTGLSGDERHLFWKRVQAAAFLALLPVFVILGVAYRALSRLRQPAR